MHTRERWQLRQRDQVLGEVIIDDADLPWMKGTWAPTPAFE